MWTIRRGSGIDQNGSELCHSDDSLTHYGVLGMKWGVRKDDKLTGGSGSKKDDDSRQSVISKIKDKMDSDTKHKDETVDTMYGKLKVNNYDSKDFDYVDSFLDTVDDVYSGRYADSKTAQERLDELPKQDNKWRTEVMQISENNHGAKTDIRYNNCFECSMSYEMRMRGYDVQAKEIRGGYSKEAMHCFNVKDVFDIQFDKPSSSDKSLLAAEAYRQMEQKCLAYGDGARGTIGIQYYTVDAGHSMYWVVENGEFRIVDSQEPYRDGYEIFLQADTVDKSVQIVRLDNAEILPGITDFVEPYEMTQEEKFHAQDVAKSLKESQKKTAQKKIGKTLEEDEQAAKARDKELWDNKSLLDKAKSKVSKAANYIASAAKKVVSSFSKKNKDDGRSFVEKLFNVEHETKRTSVTESVYKKR